MAEFEYESWAATTKTTLMEKGLWEVVESGVPPYPLKIPDLSDTEKASKLSIWRDDLVRDMKAMQVMLSSLPKSNKRQLSASSGKGLWDLLRREYEEEREKEFREMSMREGESANAYFHRVDQVVEQLRALEIEVSDFEFMEKIVVSSSVTKAGVVPLLKELKEVHDIDFETLIQYLFIHGHGFDSLTQDFLLRIMESEECIRTLKKGACFQCGGQGHKTIDCNELEPEPEEEEEEEKEEEEEEVEEEEEEIVVDHLMAEQVALDDSSYDEDMWMVSGHATIHMTRHLKFFTALDTTHKAKVGLVDGSILIAQGIGDVKIIMKEGKKKTISNVLFVPGISRNVLSINQMEYRGYSFTEENNGQCKIRDRIGAEFGEAMWVGKEVALRLRVVQGNLAS